MSTAARGCLVRNFQSLCWPSRAPVRADFICVALAIVAAVMAVFSVIFSVAFASDRAMGEACATAQNNYRIDCPEGAIGPIIVNSSQSCAALFNEFQKACSYQWAYTAAALSSALFGIFFIRVVWLSYQTSCSLVDAFKRSFRQAEYQAIQEATHQSFT